jgi:light-harvesting complex 1 beta chain
MEITMAERSLSGLTVEEAVEVHEQFKTTFSAFILIAAVAHVLVWVWKPWF